MKQSDKLGVKNCLFKSTKSNGHTVTVFMLCLGLRRGINFLKCFIKIREIMFVKQTLGSSSKLLLLDGMFKKN